MSSTLQLFVDDFGNGIMPYWLSTDAFRSRVHFYRSLEGAITLATAYQLEFENGCTKDTSIK